MVQVHHQRPQIDSFLCCGISLRWGREGKPFFQGAVIAGLCRALGESCSSLEEFLVVPGELLHPTKSSAGMGTPPALHSWIESQLPCSSTERFFPFMCYMPNFVVICPGEGEGPFWQEIGWRFIYTCSNHPVSGRKSSMLCAIPRKIPPELV